MTNLGNMSVGEFVSTLRDAGFFIGILIAGWKARSLIQPLVDMFERANKFFDRSESFYNGMEIQMNTLLNNHLSHLHQDKKELNSKESE